MKNLPFTLVTLALIIFTAGTSLAAPPISDATLECIDCHSSVHPGIVEDWQKSRHAAITVEKALAAEADARRITGTRIPKALQPTVVGCAECHTLRSDSHPDTFDHNDYPVHVVVSPPDCAVCHTQESEQFKQNLMAHAHNNLAGNTLYQQLQKSIIGKTSLKKGRVHFEPADTKTGAAACFHCHGTRVTVKGKETRETDLGEMEFPLLEGWPNQGVGRVNPDNSLGSCSACHTRHAFSIEMARKPYTCKECHVGPDVPAFKVYSASKHGNIFSAMGHTWDFKATPWTVGQDITAPTCATCHISELQNTDGEIKAQRTHGMVDRLPWRIFGLIYAHPHPIKPDTTIIRNADGLPLPTDFKGGKASDYLIDAAEQAKRTATMQAVCLTCHATTWVEGFWQRFENTIHRTDEAVRTATQLMETIWEKGYATGPGQQGNPFDEAIEKTWSDTWLFYANSTRFASAMAGGGDYGVFAEGRYQLTQRILEMSDWLEMRSQLESGEAVGKPAGEAQ